MYPDSVVVRCLLTDIKEIRTNLSPSESHYGIAPCTQSECIMQLGFICIPGGSS